MASRGKLWGCQVFHQEELPSGWKADPLGNRISLEYGAALKSETRSGGHVLVFGSNGVVGKHNLALSEPPGILIGRKGTVGAVHFASTPYWAIDTVYFVRRKQNDNWNYLYHLLCYLNLGKLNAATGVPGLSRRDAYAIRGTFPSPEEQEVIAEVLDAVDAGIDRTRTTIEKAKRAQASILQSFLYRALGRVAYADRATDLPPGWSLAPTTSLLIGDPKNGVSPTTSSSPPGVPTFSIAAVRDGCVDLGTKEHLKYAQLSDKVADANRIHRGDILIVRGNANPDLVAKCGVVGDHPEGCIYPDILKRVVFRSEGENGVLPGFVVLVWNHAVVHNQLLRRAKTSNGTLKINNRDVKQVVVPVAPKEEQLTLVNLIGAAQANIESLSELELRRQRLKTALMQDLLTGKRRLKVPKDRRAVQRTLDLAEASA